jgi:peptidoglycan/xylan/chitin deacetylase (PgdA/CDA1 family)
LKRAIKTGISFVVFAMTAIRESFIRMFGGKPRGTCIVLYYHSVPANQRQQFAQQLDVIVRHTTPVSLSGEVKLQAGVRLAGITFDDGFENFYDQAWPELEKRKIPSVMFVIADASGKAFGPAGHSERVMSLDQFRSLPENLVTLGSHTLTHPFLPSLSDDEARREIAGSRAALESVLNRKINLFSFPFGGFTERLVEICREAGYDRAFTTLPNFAFAKPNEFAVGRVRVDPTDSPLEFRLKLAGAYRWLPLAFRLKRFIVSNPLAKLVLRRSQKGAEPRSYIQELSVR